MNHGRKLILLARFAALYPILTILSGATTGCASHHDGESTASTRQAYCDLALGKAELAPASMHKLDLPCECTSTCPGPMPDPGPPPPPPPSHDPGGGDPGLCGANEFYKAYITDTTPKGSDYDEVLKTLCRRAKSTAEYACLHSGIICTASVVASTELARACSPASSDGTRTCECDYKTECHYQ